MNKKCNCWEFMNCGRAPNGEKTAEWGICPAAADPSFSGINDGPNLGWDLTYSGTVAAAIESPCVAGSMR